MSRKRKWRMQWHGEQLQAHAYVEQHHDVDVVLQVFHDFYPRVMQD